MAERVYCLYRVSTNKQVDHDENNQADIPMQRKACHDFAAKMGWVIVGEEQETGVSGYKVSADDRDKLQLIKKYKRTLYAENKEALDDIRANCGIFLSVVDLENDLDEVLHNNLCEYLDTSDPVAYLQKAKHFHMADLVEAITDVDCRTIFGHYNFACLEEITK